MTNATKTPIPPATTSAVPPTASLATRPAPIPREVAAGPVQALAAVPEDAQPFDGPEGAERRQQQADPVLERVLRNVRERSVRNRPGHEHDRAGDGRPRRGERHVVGV